MKKSICVLLSFGLLFIMAGCGNIAAEGGQEIELTASEFDIFALLILSPRRVFTYEMIADIIWNEPYDFYYKKSALNHISNLRKKLKINPEIPDYTKNVQHIDYKFDVPHTKE